ncbi:MAG: DUF4349 domain-containing protein [Leadbetterella sp.]
MKNQIVCLLIIGTCIASCHKATEADLAEGADQVAYEDSTLMATSQDLPSDVSQRKIIASAKMEIETKNTFDEVRSIEKKTKEIGGYVEYKKLNREQGFSHLVHQSLDSSLQVTSYRHVAELTIRVPKTKLDSLLQSIDPRNFKTQAYEYRLDDVDNLFRTNKRKSEFLNSTPSSLNKSNIKRSMATIVEAKSNAIDMEEGNNEINYSVKYATFNVNVHQPFMKDKSMIANIDYLENIQEPFFFRLGQSFKASWGLFLSILFFCIENLILIILFCLLAYFLLIYRRRRV